MTDLTALAVGDELFTRTFTVDRALLVRYAGASGDFNPIHWNERVAREVGLDGVIAHGMATMGLAAAAVTEWAGDPGAVVDYGVRFTRPRSEEHTSELQSRGHLVCRLLLEKKKK